MSNSDNQNGSKPDGITTRPLPASQKAYVYSHARPDISVPMRAITLSGEPGGNGHANAIMVYDTSGPYTDPDVTTDIRAGLKPLRLDWIKARGDVEEISGPHDVNGNGKNGSHTERFPDEARRPVLRAKPGRNVSQMPEAEKIAGRGW